MSGRFVIAAALLVLAAWALASSLDAEADAPAMSCAEWEAGAWAPPVVQSICTREALMRRY